MEYGGQKSKVKMLLLQQCAWHINEVKQTAKHANYADAKRKPLHKFHVIDGQNRAYGKAGSRNPESGTGNGTRTRTRT